jgi:SAM-dependent methyltransferase
LHDGKPVLLRSDNMIFHPSTYMDETVDSSGWRRMVEGMIPDNSINLANRRVMQKFANQVAADRQIHLLVIGCGRQKVWLDQRFARLPHINLHYTDINKQAIVDLFCDGHELPFADNSFDGVITTAVLEHVLCPEKVASEIHRVLAADGIIYSELPFMQQVHGGCYDLTRFTLTGHRRLFNHFSEIESGMVAGPATSLLWAIEHFFLSFFRVNSVRLAIKALVRLSLFWIKYLDYMFDGQPQAMDGASCTYYFGRKRESIVSDLDILKGYVGGSSTMVL